MFRDLYKQSLDEQERQETRRKKLLQKQKLKRLQQQDERRDHQEHHPYERKTSHKRYKNTNIERIQLQWSEWFKEKPENFDDWLLVPCPKGQRCLVVAAKGETKMFSKNKRYRMTFQSLLPGGGINGSNNDFCILDCIYNKEMDMFFVLDGLTFCVPLMDCDAEFRFFWLKSKFNELNDLGKNYKPDNLKRFQLLDYYDMSNEERLSMALQRIPLWQDNKPQLDGFLFYHKESHYVCGTTPLVCWLFPFMLPDVLQMTVSDFYEPPATYCNRNPWRYMDEFDKEMARKKLRIKKELDQNEMITELNSTPMEKDQYRVDDRLDRSRKLQSSEDRSNTLEALLVEEKLLEMN